MRKRKFLRKVRKGYVIMFYNNNYEIYHYDPEALQIEEFYESGAHCTYWSLCEVSLLLYNSKYITKLKDLFSCLMYIKEERKGINPINKLRRYYS